MELARVICTLLAFGAIVMAVVSLITPRAALLNKKKTRLRGMLTWLGGAVVLLVGAFMLFPLTPEEVSQQQAKRAEREAIRAEEARAKQARHTEQEAVQVQEKGLDNVVPVPLLPFFQEEIHDTSHGSRKRAQVRIYLADPTLDVTPQALAASCAAAAKHYAETYGFQALSVFLADMPGGQSWEGTRLAMCEYSPDKGGWSGNDGWLWNTVKAAPRGVTNEERRMKALWGELRGQYQKDGVTDEEALSREIAKRMGIQPGQVGLPWIMLEDVPSAHFEGVAPQGPAAPKAEPSAGIAPTAEEVRGQVRELLNELDSFKDSSIFAECMYGCGERNPGLVWNAKRKALQEQMTPQLDVPLLLKAAPGDLWMLGKAYARGKDEEAREVRAGIEKALEQ